MFDPEIIKQLSDAFNYDFMVLFEPPSGDVVSHLHLSGQNRTGVEKLMREIEQAIFVDGDEKHNKICLKLKLVELLNMLDALFQPFEGGNQAESEYSGDIEELDPIAYRDRIEQIKKYIVSHIEERLNLDEIADKFYINRYYLSHYFKTETGFTLSQYVTNQKIIAAKKMLMSGMSVTDVALQLSYKSDSHFITVFKKRTGTTPKGYVRGENSKNA